MMNRHCTLIAWVCTINLPSHLVQRTACRMPDQMQSPATKQEMQSSEKIGQYLWTSECRLLSQAIFEEMIQVQSSSGIQRQFQIATASCKHRGRGLQTQKWISWSKGTEVSPTSWPSPAGTPVGACTVVPPLLQVARVQLQWWMQHQRRGIGTHQWSDLNGIIMNGYVTLSWDS